MSKKRSRRRFTDEFKGETVKLVKQSDRTMSAIAMELGISTKFVGAWVRSAADSGKPKIPTPAVGLGISLDHQAASLVCSSHCSKNNAGERPLSDPWGRSTLYS